jgi:hypothetical protein
MGKHRQTIGLVATRSDQNIAGFNIGAIILTHTGGKLAAQLRQAGNIGIETGAWLRYSSGQVILQ